MKHLFLVLSLAGTICLSLTPASAGAQGIFDANPEGDIPTGISGKECQKAIVLELARAQRKFRAVLYGYPKAEDAPVSTVRFTTDGIAWIKVGTNEWRSVAPGKEGVSRSNSEMDIDDEFISTEWSAGRRGFFRTRRVLTSELVPYLAQSIRAFQCEVDTVCDRALASLTKTEIASQTITLNPLGCIQKTVPTLPACHLGALNSNALAESNIRTFCPSTVDNLLQREGDILKLAVEYDAAYRSVLQFSGNFDLFLEEFRWPLQFTIRQAAGLIGHLNRIPCFLSSCEDLLPVFAPSASTTTPPSSP
ncbi:MAG TPA: hypothetical protein VI913_02325 [Candidatus Peribacteraceae bacterium]|nr:hypothetical protein [Candidatus Peribacteraceae bacterium]